MQALFTHRRPKQTKAVDTLSQLAARLGPGAKMPTVQELSQSLGITKVTLSLCLQQLEDAGMITRRAGSGIYVSPQIFQKNIGLVFGKNIFAPGVSPIYGQLIEHCAARASRGNERFSFYLAMDAAPNGDLPTDSNALHRDLREAFETGKLHGVILACPVNDEQEAWLRAQGVPLVATSEKSRFSGRSAPDYQLLIRMGVQVLVARGYRRIGIIGLVDEHLRIFENTMVAMGLPLTKSWVIGNEGREDPVANHAGLGREAVRRLLRTPDGCGLPQGLLSTDDIITAGICTGLQQAGIEIAKDIKIVSHANEGSAVLAEWEDHIIRLEISSQEMVENIFLMLETLMAGLPLPQDVILVQPRLKSGVRS